MMSLRFLLARRRVAALLGTTVAALAAAAAPLAAQGAPDPLFRDFQPIGTYALSMDGKGVPGAEIFQSERARAFLLLSSQLDSPLLVNLRSRRVETVGFLSLARRGDGAIDVLADAEIAPVGSFEIVDDGISFTHQGRKVALTSRESLTGRRSAEALTEYDPSYGRGAELYQPNQSLVAQLKQQKTPVRVQVFFNSKCSACKEMVPRIIKLERALAGSSIRFDYYGAPDDYQDPELKKKDVSGVPTGIVYLDGKEVGRITGGEWRMPELAIKNLLIQKS